MRWCTNHWRDSEEWSVLDRLLSLVNHWSQWKAGCISISQSFCPPSLSGAHHPAAWSSQWVHLNQCLSPCKGWDNIQGPIVRTERGKNQEWDPASQPEQTLWEARPDTASGASGQISPARGCYIPNSSLHLSKTSDSLMLLPHHWRTLKVCSPEEIFLKMALSLLNDIRQV